MAHIILNNVSLEYPIYDISGRSFRKMITQSVSIGGAFHHQGKQSKVVAVKDLSLELRAGDRVALLGHNGAGKTSLLKMLAGFYEPITGSIDVSGRVTSLLNLMAGLDANLNGYENIDLCGKLFGLTQKEIAARVQDIVEFSELGNYLNMPVRLYSAGMMLRLAFSICTSVDCEILLLDEWVGAGDQGFLQKAQERMSAMIDGSVLLVLATHNIEVARTFCNKAIFLQNGEVLDSGELEEVISSYLQHSSVQ